MMETLLQVEGLTLLGWRNVQIASWTTQGTIELVEQLAEQSTCFHKRHPEGVSVIHVISKGPALPDSETRERLGMLLQAHSGSLACIGVILDGRGFWASAVRGFLVGLRLVAPRTFTMQVFSTPEEVAEWLPGPHKERTGVRLDPTELLKAIAAVRVTDVPA